MSFATSTASPQYAAEKGNHYNLANYPQEKQYHQEPAVWHTQDRYPNSHRSKSGSPNKTSSKQEVASLGMHPDQRHHSNLSTASTAISAHSHASSSSSHSRLTAKFPIPRLFCSESQGGTSGVSSRSPTSRLMLAQPESAKLRADVAARIAQQDARERKARWTRAKWLLLLSVTTVSSSGGLQVDVSVL